MRAVETFEFGNFHVRTIVSIDGDPWFVATDVANILGYDRASNMTRMLDEDEKGAHRLSTPGGDQEVTVISEPGLFSAILRSRVERARAFKRWVTHEVLPSIHKTGAYVIPESREQLLARAVIEANSAIREAHEQITSLTPRAEAWDQIASADGDYSVADAAKMLARAGIETGPQRLFEQMARLKWIFRGHDKKWRAYADTVSDGYLAERPQSHYHPVTGDLVVDAPQVRVTLRSVERLRVRLGVLTVVEAVTA